MPVMVTMVRRILLDPQFRVYRNASYQTIGRRFVFGPVDG